MQNSLLLATMKAIGFFAIFAILISNYEANGAKTDVDIADGPAFVDNDFTDYQAGEEEDYLKRETGFSDSALTPLRDLKPNITSNGNPNPEVVNTLLNTAEASFKDTAPIPLESILKRIEKRNLDDKAKAFRRAKRIANYTSLMSVDEDKFKINFETILKRINKLNPEKEKALLRAKREASFSDAPTSLKDNIKSAFRRNEELNPKEIKAAKKETRVAKKYAAAMKLKHDIMVTEIMDFMKRNLMTTNYLYEEVQRIKAGGRTQKRLRALVHYLEDDHNIKLKDSVLQCFYARRKIDKRHLDPWTHGKTNNLIINALKDPYNDGFVN